MPMTKQELAWIIYKRGDSCYLYHDHETLRKPERAVRFTCPICGRQIYYGRHWIQGHLRRHRKHELQEAALECLV